MQPRNQVWRDRVVPGFSNRFLASAIFNYAKFLIRRYSLFLLFSSLYRTCGYLALWTPISSGHSLAVNVASLLPSTSRMTFVTCRAPHLKITCTWSAWTFADHHLWSSWGSMFPFSEALRVTFKMLSFHVSSPSVLPWSSHCQKHMWLRFVMDRQVS